MNIAEQLREIAELYLYDEVTDQPMNDGYLKLLNIVDDLEGQPMTYEPTHDNPVLSCCGDTLMSHDYDGCHGKRWDGSGCSCNAHLLLLAHLADVGRDAEHTNDDHCPLCAGSCGGA